MVVKSFCKILKAISAYTENTDQMFILKKNFHLVTLSLFNTLLVPCEYI
jgi:hypothetical protein